MTTVRLLVLGVCRRHGRVHGYAVHRALAEWRVETWTNVRPGSIYHALKQLTTEGKLRQVGDEPGSGGPARTVYEFTDAGEAEFVTLLEGALSSFALVEFSAGVAFMDALPRHRAVEILRATHERLVANVDGLRTLSERHPDRRPAPHTRDLLELWSGSLDATATWIEGSLERLQGGEYVMAGEPGAA
jgi:DNA-binding PadR family transcriptional regulator